ncbi:MAG: hypothetical protein HY876_00995 [Coriobacteriales bacterium]|nr:hypothetical protein [Coriobacteriales bacterium]
MIGVIGATIAAVLLAAVCGYLAGSRVRSNAVAYGVLNGVVLMVGVLAAYRGQVGSMPWMAFAGIGLIAGGLAGLRHGYGRPFGGLVGVRDDAED